MKKIILSVLMVTALFVLAACGSSSNGGSGSSSDKIVLKFGHHLSENHTLGKQADLFAQKISEKTDGRITVDVYANGQIGDQRDLIEGLKIGTVDMSLGDTAVVSNYYTPLGILDLPQMFETMEEGMEIVSGELGDVFKEEIEQQIGIKTLVIEPVGYRFTVLGKDKKVSSLDEFNGLKLRTLESPQIVGTFKELGVQTVALPTGEALSAMETGVVDGLESNAEFLSTINIWDLGKYIVETNHNLTFETINISTATWAKLSAEDQKLILETLDESVDAYFQDSLAANVSARELMEEKGMETLDIDVSRMDSISEKVIEGYVKDNKLEKYHEIIKKAKE